jgi:TolB-like protein/tetratricopeptide (TPR) repeat protein
MTETPRALTTTREGLPAALDAAVSRSLAKNPADRWQTAQQFADALGRAMDTLRSGERVAAVAPAAGPSPVQVWGLFGFASLITLGVFYGLVSRWGLPVWVLYLAIALLAIGAVVLTVTGRMETRRRAGAAPGGIARLFTWRNATLGGVLALGTWALVVTGVIIRGPGGAGAGGAVRLAVLPFDNSGAADDAYFVDGIANQIRGKLTGLAGFEVTARSSTDHYKGTTKSPQDIGKELGVDYLLGATVTWAKAGTGGGKVQVSPELIDVRTGASRWQQSFNSDVSDVFEVQGQIASEVAGALGVALGAKEQQQLAKRPTQNLAAYDLFLKAQALNVTDPATFRQAAALYEQAVVLDSAFALAWAGLGTSLSLQYFLVTPTPALASRAKQATEKALALAPNEPASHAARAEYFLDIVKDPAQAWEQVSLALAAAPNDPVLLGSAGTIAKNAGRWDDAVRYLQQARRLDPRSIDVAEQLQRVLLFSRRYPEALATGTAALALSPTSLGIIENQATIHLAQGDLGGARAVLAAAPVALSQPALVAYVVRYWDLYWLLTDEQQQLVLRLPVSAMYDDLVGWAMALTQTAWNQGDKAKALAYADTARVAVQAQLKASPDDAGSHAMLGLALAYLGQKDLAIAEGKRAVALVPISRDHNAGAYFQHQLTRIYIRVGEPEPALDAIEPLLKVPYLLSPGWLRIDPEFAPLKGNPRFERLIKGGA